MLILGLNMFHADASAAIVQDGEVIFAIAEERLNRAKHYGGFPALAVKACLDAVGAVEAFYRAVARRRKSVGQWACITWASEGRPEMGL